MTRAELKAALRAGGLRLTKRRGQNMLVHAGVRDRLVEAMALRPGDTVVEIGAGTGALTESIAAKVRRVVAFEIDRGLVELLRGQCGALGSVEIRHEDFLDVDLEKRTAGVEGDELVIAGNLPYSITTPVIARVLESGVRHRAAYFTVQREVAARLLAKAGSRDRGAITLLVEYHADARRLMKVARTAFEPVPEVESVLIELAAPREPPVTPRDPALMFAVIRAAFGSRRKMLKNALAHLEWGAFTDESPAAGNRLSAAIDACGLDPKCRGERLTLEQFAALSDALARRQPAT